MATLSFQLYLFRLEVFSIALSLFDQLLIISLELRKLHLGLLKLFSGLFNFTLVFFENCWTRVSKHCIKDFDTIVRLLRQYTPIDFLNNLFEEVSLFQDLDQLLKRVLLKISVLLQLKLIYLRLLMLVLERLICTFLTLNFFLLRSHLSL